jgi:hypothetical protein
MKTLIKTLLVASLLLPSALRAGIPSLFDIFDHSEVLQLELEFDMDEMYAKVNTNDEYPAVFRFQDQNGNWVELASELRARGRFRRRTCEFPPLRIDFSKKDLRARGLLDFDDLKLVTHCMEGRAGKEAVLREYLTYKMYSQLTDKALRAQLVEVTYKDTESNAEQTAYGILLEDVDELAARLGSEECDECYGLTAMDLQQDNLKTHAMFQYMIGNTDWSLPQMRNLKVMKPINGGAYWVAPYDFDFSGIVSASYAIPSTELGQKKIGDRVYLGSERTNMELEATADYFRSKKSALMATVNDFELLSKRDRREITEYLDSFYEALDNGIICQELADSGCSTNSGAMK